MKCIKCNKIASIDLKHLGGSLCSNCFAEVIEKRVRKSLRQHDWLKPKDKVLVIDDNSLKSKVSIYLLKSIFKGKPFNLSFKKGSVKSAEKLSKGYDKVIIPWNLDDEAEQHLDALFNNKKIKKTRFIKLLLNVSDEEIDYFARIKKIRGRKKAKTELGKKLDALEKRYPCSKFGLQKSLILQ
ncbi:hypothetical protein KY346_01850 [Candidatus Woesearchaeota archaeon]|nr:hypothetical protein [Candidatus Woesearchaeota archaeon]